MNRSIYLNKKFIFLIATALLVSCEKENSPVLTTSPVKEITSNTAISGGSIKSEGGSPVTEYGICWGENNYPTVENCDSLIYSDSDKVSYECRISGLIAGTMYHVRAFAINSDGTSYGEDMSFLTRGEIALPLCITLGAVIDSLGITKLDRIDPLAFSSFFRIRLEKNSPVLCGAVITNDLPTSVFFEYGPTTSYGNIVKAYPTNVSGNQMTCYISKKLQVGEYLPCTEFHFRIKAENKNGTFFGEDKVMSIYPTESYYGMRLATNVSGNGVTLNGILNGGSDAPYYANPLAPVYVDFEYGVTPDYGQSVPADQSPITGMFPEFVSTNISGLTPGIVYHYRIMTSSGCSKSWTSDATFLTVEDAPVCRTVQNPFFGWRGTPGYILLEGKVIARDVPAEVVFEYGTTAQYGQYLIAEQSPITFNSGEEITVTSKITKELVTPLGLQFGGKYHFRVKVTNRNATVYGNDGYFYIPE